MEVKMADLPKMPLKRIKQEPEESGLKLNDLPVLPFEKVLSYLPLADLIKSMAVCRRWYKTIDSFRVKALCYSQLPSGFILEKSRWTSGAFAENFISTTKFKSFFSTFSRSILSNLKHLRLCNPNFNMKKVKALSLILSSFVQLEALDIFSFDSQDEYQKNLKVNLSMLRSIYLKKVYIPKVTLNSPRLQSIQVWNSCPIYDYLRLHLIHASQLRE